MSEAVDHTETEEKIFSAALDVFSRKGKDGARMHEIAETAGINQAMLHYYFRSKERLYEAVFAYVFRTFMEALKAPLESDLPYSEFLRGFIDSFISLHARNPRISRLWMLENLAGAPVAGPMFRDLIAADSTAAPIRFISRTAEAVKRGEIRDVDPFQTFVTLIGASVFLFIAFPTLATVNPAIATDLLVAAEDRKKHVFDLLYHGMKKTDA